MTLSMEEAQQTVGGNLPARLLEGLRQELAARHASNPQAAGLAAHAMNLVEEGLVHLAALGHSFSLRRVEPSMEVEKFPMVLYKSVSGSDATKIVTSEGEMEEAMREGWASTQTQPSAGAPEGEGEER